MAERSFNPSRLTLARKRKGFTKGELAGQIGVELRSVTAYESGEFPPSEDTLNRIEAATEFPVEFFFGDDLDEPCLDTASFRSMSKMTSGQRDMALGQGAIALHLNKWLEKRFELPPSRLPDLSQEPSPEAAASSLRQYWGLGELPVRNMIHLLESRGVRIFSLSIHAREVDAFSIWKESTPFIFLNTQKSAERSRYDAAHELGHLVLHRHAAPQGREAELEANEFASAFLMPRAGVLALVRPFPTIATLTALKKQWTVSVAALNHRLHSVGLLSDWHYRQLCIEISKRGLREHEPEGAPRETSQVLPKLFALLHGDGISRSQVAKELTIYLSELEQLMFGLTMTSVAGKAAVRSAEERPRQGKLQLVKG